MELLNQELSKLLEKVNQAIQKKQGSVMDGDKNKLRTFIDRNIGRIVRVDKLTIEELESIQTKGGISGVDGSVNRSGGSYPHFIEVYQAMAKSTGCRNDPVVLAETYTPILSEESEDPLSEEGELREEQRNIRLATLEVEAAIRSVTDQKPYALMMDGGLIRYNIYAGESWRRLVDLCEETETILMGVIKDIKTSAVGEEIKKVQPELKGVLYDRELLFGLLEYGEFISISYEINRKEPLGYSSGFMRSSLSPMVIGLDIIESQKDKLLEMARLVLTLTPENSRGVPLWLDIVDKEVKISDDMMRALMERYLDRGVYERYFVSERDKRN